MKKYNAIKGNLPRRFEIAQWKEGQFLQYFEVVNYFMNNGTIKVTPDKMIALEKEVLEGTTSFKQEILFRINQFTTDPEVTPRKFLYKLLNFNRNVGSFLRLHPSQVTEEMKKVMEVNPRLAGYLSQYKAHETKIGAIVVVPETHDPSSISNRHLPAAKDPQVRMQEALAKTADVFITIANSITKKEIKDLPIKDKLTALSKLNPIVNMSRKYQPNVGTFNQIVIHKAERDDLEKSLLEFGES